MRIEGIYREGLVPFVTARFVCPTLSTDREIVFIVDTGASMSVISTKTCKELKINYDLLKEHGNSKYRSADINALVGGPCKFIFNNVDEIPIDRIKFEMDSPTYTTDINVIGMDVLKNFHISFSGNKAILEK